MRLYSFFVSTGRHRHRFRAIISHDFKQSNVSCISANTWPMKRMIAVTNSISAMINHMSCHVTRRVGGTLIAVIP